MSHIIDHGLSEYQIVTPGRAAPSEQLAAQNLQEALHRMTGVRLPLRDQSQRVAEHPAMFVGVGREQETPGGPGLWEKDSYEIVPQGRDLLLAGSGRRGTHYAIYAFLEMLGARFYAPNAEHWPILQRVPLPQKAIRSTAAFSYRHVFYPIAQSPQWALPWKLNVHTGSDACWGPNARAYSLGHSFAQLVPVADHFRRHPEYFSLVDGLRRQRHAQLCCTNPQVAEAASQTMAQWIAAHPEPRIFPVGMNDWDGWCECPRCAQVDRHEGSHIGQVLTLVNRVAQNFPERVICTLAYAWAIDPPRHLHARDNALIVLCHNQGCYTHALDACAHNRQFVQRLRAWKRRCQRILIWDYYVNYHSYLMPTPNFRRIAADLRIYRDLGIEAIFCQGSAVPGGQFEGLRQYLQAQLLWNPDQDASAIIEEWVTGVYGTRAGAFILEYLTMLEDHVQRNQVHMLSFGGGQEVQPQVFTPEILQRGARLWDKAEAAADEQTRAKVFAARAPEMCARLFHTGMRYQVRGTTLAPAPGPDKALSRRFAWSAIQGGAAHLRENAGTPESFARNYGRTYRALILESEQLRAIVVPELGGRLYSLQWKPTGLELMHVSDLARKVNFLPYGSGYEFTLEPRWQGLGTSEEYRVLRQGWNRAVLQADLATGLRVRSEYGLSDNTLRVLHRVRNRGKQAVTLQPFTHPEWNFHAFGPGARLRLWRGGSWRSLPINPENRRHRDLEFAKGQMPRGAWQLLSAVAPLVLEETFAAAPVQHTRVMFGGWGNLNLELHFKPRTLRPGQGCAFQTSWCIRGER